MDWIGLILFGLGHPLSHWLLFRGPSNHKYRINKQTNKHTTYIQFVNCYYKCQMFNHAMFNSFGGCSGHSSLFSLDGGRGAQKRPETPSLGLDLSPSHNSALVVASAAQPPPPLPPPSLHVSDWGLESFHTKRPYKLKNQTLMLCKVDSLLGYPWQKIGGDCSA